MTAQPGPDIYARNPLTWTYELTFVHPDGDWTWQRHICRDFHEAMCKALTLCPDLCRVQNVRCIPQGRE